MNQIHFDFIVDSNEAKVIYNGVQELINNCNEQIQNLSFQLECSNNTRAKNIQPHIDWYKAHKQYLENILTKMKSSPIKL